MVHKEMKEDLVDGVTNVLEEVVMTATKLGGQQEQGHGAVLAKNQLSSLSRSGDMDSLAKSCENKFPISYFRFLLFLPGHSFSTAENNMFSISLFLVWT